MSAISSNLPPVACHVVKGCSLSLPNVITSNRRRTWLDEPWSQSFATKLELHVKNIPTKSQYALIQRQSMHFPGSSAVIHVTAFQIHQVPKNHLLKEGRTLVFTPLHLHLEDLAKYSNVAIKYMLEKDSKMCYTNTTTYVRH